MPREEFNTTTMPVLDTLSRSENVSRASFDRLFRWTRGQNCIGRAGYSKCDQFHELLQRTRAVLVSSEPDSEVVAPVSTSANPGRN